MPLNNLQALAGPTVTFHGRLDDASTTELIHACSAVIFPETEHFGIVPLAAGGALETLEDGVTSVMFREPSVDALVEAPDRLQALDTAPEVIARAASRFSPEAFETNLNAAIERARDRLG